MMTTLIASTSLMASPLSSKAVSLTAEFIADEITQNRRYMQSSMYWGLNANSVRDELCDIYDKCREPNWDGYGAQPVTAETYRYAYLFLESMPWNTPVPSVGAEPDGCLTLEWHHSPRRTLSVSFSPDGDLHYAALLGASKAFGSEPFFGEVPQTIAELTNRVCAE